MDRRTMAWSEERRKQVSEIHRRRWGAPDGMATLYGVHIALEHRPILTLFATRICHRKGREAAHEYVREGQAAGWPDMLELKRLYEQAMLVRENAKTIRKFNNEVLRHANQNRR